MTVLATAVPHAPFEQSLIPKPKFTLLHRQDGSGELQPRVEYCPITLLKQVCPHEGRDEMAGNVEVEDVVVTEVLVFTVELEDVDTTEVLVFAVEELVRLLVFTVEELFELLVEALNEELITGLQIPHSG